MTTVRIQVIKVYDIKAPEDCRVEEYELDPNPINWAYAQQTTWIEANGKLIDATTDHAEIVEDQSDGRKASGQGN